VTLDPYNACPCGSGKKLKFCCSDLAGELEKIERMLEGQQHAACLRHIEQLEAKYPDQAYLLDLKIGLLRIANRYDDAKAAVQKFLEFHPRHPMAHIDSSIQLGAENDLRGAVLEVQRAWDLSAGVYSLALAHGVLNLVRLLLLRGHVVSARGHLLVLLRVDPENEDVASMMVELDRHQSIPLLLKEFSRPRPSTEESPWQQAHNKAIDQAQRGYWVEARDALKPLVAEHPRAADAWFNLGLLHAFLIEEDESTAALRHYVELPIPQDDAVETEAVAQLLNSKEPTQESLVELVQRSFSILEIDDLVARLTANPRTTPLSIDPDDQDEDEPLPRAAFGILDRKRLAEDETPTLDSVPRVVGQAIVFGKQTDRDALLQLVGHDGDSLTKSLEALGEIAGESLGEEVADSLEVLDQTTASRRVLIPNWFLPPGISPELADELSRAFWRDALLNRWVDVPNYALEGQSPNEAAGQGRTIPVLAEILNLEMTPGNPDPQFDFNELRRKLNLPEAGQIAGEGIDSRYFPLARVPRLQVEQLSEDDLQMLLTRAGACRFAPAMHTLITELLSRPELADDATKAKLYGILASIAPTPDEALEHLDKACEFEIAAGNSPARWLVEELAIRMARGQGEHVERLFQTISEKHFNEPGIRERLMNLLQSFGLIGPDGQPGPAADPGIGEVGASVGAESSAAGAGTEGSPSSGLWTPGQPEATPRKKSAIWTPDMD
jgi:tetratricopeptide (TPR) repeat protein